MKKLCWIVVATLISAASASAQTQYQTSFEIGLGYARPAVGRFDMASVLMQGDDYLFETGIGLDINGSTVSTGDETAFSWLIRAAVRPIVLGNTLVHIGGEFSLHTKSAIDVSKTPTEVGTLTAVSALFGVSQPLVDHFNVSVQIYPIVLEFGSQDTVVRIVRASIGAHLLF
ncbi:MAG: hypothetical protein JSW67_10845 [Candidatus Latescibacterota bacterium]|nr:MAG: hypothetical protein JSW67_10845 [Candidatus Latescibacterota bacterium]